MRGARGGARSRVPSVSLAPKARPHPARPPFASRSVPPVSLPSSRCRGGAKRSKGSERQGDSDGGMPPSRGRRGGEPPRHGGRAIVRVSEAEGEPRVRALAPARGGDRR